jgi:hypothetical protein
MRKIAVASSLITLMVILAIGLAYAQSEKAIQEQQEDNSSWWCPWCGRSMGSDYGGYGGMRGHMMGPGYGGYGGPWGHMMGPGGMTGYGPWRGYGNTGSEKPLSKEEATKLFERYVKATDNPNLKLGKVTEDKNNFVGEITTKDGSLVDKILVNKNTGWMRPAR